MELNSFHLLSRLKACLSRHLDESKLGAATEHEKIIDNISFNSKLFPDPSSNGQEAVDVEEGDHGCNSCHQTVISQQLSSLAEGQTGYEEGDATETDII